LPAFEHHTYSENDVHVEEGGIKIKKFFRAKVGKKVIKINLVLFQITTFGCRRVH
jgi:hypothetical protein